MKGKEKSKGKVINSPRARARTRGLDAFLDAFDQKTAEIEELERDHRRLRNPASSFQKLLNKRFPKGQPASALRATARQGGVA